MVAALSSRRQRCTVALRHVGHCSVPCRRGGDSTTHPRGAPAGQFLSPFPRDREEGTPAQGGALQALELTVRGFFCDLPGCHRRVFAERLPITAAAYCRRTVRAAAALQAIGFAAGGRPGARLAARLGLTASPAIVLAQVRSAPAPATVRRSRLSALPIARFDAPRWCRSITSWLRERIRRAFSTPAPLAQPVVIAETCLTSACPEHAVGVHSCCRQQHCPSTVTSRRQRSDAGGGEPQWERPPPGLVLLRPPPRE
jgi:hypothetical protein